MVGKHVLEGGGFLRGFDFHRIHDHEKNHHEWENDLFGRFSFLEKESSC